MTRLRTCLAPVLAMALSAGAIAWAADLFRAIGLLLYPQQFLTGMLAIALPLVFLTYRASRARVEPESSICWFDGLCAIVGAGAAIFMALRYPTMAELVYEAPASGLVAGVIVLGVTIEALRRTVGHVLTGLVAVFIALGLLGHLLPSPLTGRPLHAETLFYFLAWDPTAMLGTPMVIVTTVVTLFVFFGQVLLRSGGSDFFTDLSMLLVGRYRGGQAKIAVTASGMFGSISGSAVSNVATTGIITIPLMRDAGYRPHHAGAIEAAASTGGQLMPPIMGAAAFLMAEFLEIAYTEVVLAAVVPAVLYYVALFILADLEAAKGGVQRVPASAIPAAATVLKNGWYFLVPFVVLIGALFWLNYTPEFAALLAALAMGGLGLLFGYRGKRLRPAEIVEALRNTGVAVLDIIMIGAAAGIVIGVLSASGLGFALTLALVKLGGGNLPALLLAAAGICIILGMGMPTAGVYVLLATLVAPSLVEVGIEPLAAHLFILYFGMMSMITPPVAIAAFAAASLTGTDAMRTGFSAMRFGWLAYLIPFLFVASPALLLKDSLTAIALAVISTTGGVWSICVGIVGYLFRSLTPVVRLGFALAGLALLVPFEAMEHAGAAKLIGLAAVAALAWREARLHPAPCRPSA